MEDALAVISISRSLYSGGKVIAEKVADRLGYGCISGEVICEAAREHHVSESKLVSAIHDKPSFLDHFTVKKDRELAYIHESLLARARKGNVVYHGLAGHFLLKGFFHVLKVRITADLKRRTAIMQQQHGASDLEASRMLKLEDEARRKWSRKHYGIDQTDAGLYDLVVNIDKISESDAVDIICRVASTKHFMVTPESQKTLDDATLASRVRSRLISLTPDVEVLADGGTVLIKTGAGRIYKGAVVQEVKWLARSVPGVSEVRVETFQMPLFHE